MTDDGAYLTGKEISISFVGSPPVPRTFRGTIRGPVGELVFVDTPSMDGDRRLHGENYEQRREVRI